MSSLILTDLILKMISQLSALFLNDAKIAQTSRVSVLPFTEQMGLLAQRGLLMRLTLRQEDAVVEKPQLLRDPMSSNASSAI